MNEKMMFAGVDVDSTPVFKTQAEYEAWAEKFSNEMKPILDKHAKLRLKAMQKAREHIVD